MILLVLLALLKENHSAHAWLVFIPFLLPILFWKVLGAHTSIPADFAEGLGSSIGSLALAWAGFCLLGERVVGDRSPVRSPLVLALLVAVGIAGLLDIDGLSFSQEGLQSLVVFGMGALAIIGGLLLAGKFCRNHYTAGRFTGWFLLGVIIAQVGLLLVLLCTFAIFDPRMLRDLPRLLSESVLMGLLLGVVMYLISIPFLVLFFRSDFYRPRFLRCFRLEEN